MIDPIRGDWAKARQEALGERQEGERRGEREKGWVREMERDDRSTDKGKEEYL